MALFQKLIDFADTPRRPATPGIPALGPAPFTVCPLARDLRVLVSWPFPFLGFGLDGRLLLARRGRVYVQFIIIIIIIFGFWSGRALSTGTAWRVYV